MKAVAHLGGASRENECRFVAEAELAFAHLQMAQVGGQVLCLHIDLLRVDDVEVLRQLDQVAVVFEAAVALAAVDVGNVRRSADGGKGKVLAAEEHPAVGGRALQFHKARGGFQGLGDQPAVEVDHQAALIDGGAGLAVVLPGAGMQDLDAQFFQDPESGLVDCRNAVVRERRLV